jgi:NADH-quinone oxidoreductase subunit C
LNTIGIYELIKERLKVVASFQEVEGPTPSIYIRSDFLLETMNFLKKDDALLFEVLMSQTAFHETEGSKLFWHLYFELPKGQDEAHSHEELRLFWHLYSYTHAHRVVIESSIPLGIPVIDSVVSVWKGADWLEREIYDLLGIQFQGHPDLRRIMLPEDWEGYPLRKDYVNPLIYQSIDNTPSDITRSFQPKGK